MHLRITKTGTVSIVKRNEFFKNTYVILGNGDGTLTEGSLNSVAPLLLLSKNPNTVVSSM